MKFLEVEAPLTRKNQLDFWGDPDLGTWDIFKIMSKIVPVMTLWRIIQLRYNLAAVVLLFPKHQQHILGNGLDSF